VVEGAVERDWVLPGGHAGEATSLEHVPVAVRPAEELGHDELALHGAREGEGVVHQPALEGVEDEVLVWVANVHLPDVAGAFERLVEEGGGALELERGGGLAADQRPLEVEELSIELKEAGVGALGLGAFGGAWALSGVVAVGIDEPEQPLA